MTQIFPDIQEWYANKQTNKQTRPHISCKTRSVDARQAKKIEK